MDILQLLQLQGKLIPDLFEKFNKRYELLVSIKNNQPIGRRNLIDIVGLTERQLRTECDTLYKLGLISKNTTGMTISQDGESFLLEINNFLRSDAFGAERKIIKEHFGIKEVYVIAGDFSKSQETRKDMVMLLFEKINIIIDRECVLGVSGGSTMGYIASMADKTFAYGKDITITPIRGALTISNTGFQSNDIATKLAVNTNHRYQLLHAPDNIGKATLEELMKEPIVKSALDIIKNTSIIIHSIGDAFEMARRRKLSKEVLKLLEDKNAYSESFGSYFDYQGNVIYETETIGMNSEDVEKVSNIFTIVGGGNKADATFSYLNSKPKNTTLIIDEAICKQILTKVITQ
ncbi:transcriptional regulator [Gemella sp. 19428wG2_WT2a]|nr:transcriptional regulator [Gemella sp. 19428wG2_WT2a]TFU58567.1 transcriptional regulator [Gemella sp. WT2a]